ncbi:MAG: PhnD/SsuA/transferrin family substrate-binding protein [Pseudomonadota bacterium]
MIASLPMYDRPETRAAHDRFWHLIRSHLPSDIEAPERLQRGSDPWTDWRHPDLFLSQTCGLPFRAELHKDLALVATPVHDLPGCPAGYYRSVLVARRTDTREDLHAFRGARLALNDPLSQSGWAAVESAGVGFGSGRLTGSHSLSARAVAEGLADIAAIDAVSWAGISRWDVWASDLRIIAETEPTPALPYVTAHPDLVENLSAALAAAADQLSSQERVLLGTSAVIQLTVDRYTEIPLPTVPEDHFPLAD